MKDRIIGTTMNDVYTRLVERLMYPEFKISNKEGKGISELIDQSFTITDVIHCFATIRDLSIEYLEGELDFYYSGSPFLRDIVKHSSFWKKVTDDGRSINSNYGKKILHDRNLHNWTQFEYAEACLYRNKESKKAVMTIYDSQNAFMSNDNPCTMYLQFFIRDNQLHLYANMRSNDVWFGIPYDVPFFVSLMHLMRMRLLPKYPDVLLGTYNHRAGSLHMYDRNIVHLEKVLLRSRNRDKELIEDHKLFNQIIAKKVREWMDKIDV